MSKVEIYTKTTCPYCTRAKALLNREGIAFTEYDVTNDNALWDKMLERADGRSTVPQIFINDKGIGGCDDLHMLDANDELKDLL